MLPCGHTLCSPCLTRWSNRWEGKEVQCHECIFVSDPEQKNALKHKSKLENITALLHAMEDKIDGEMKNAAEERATVAAAISASADQLMEAVKDRRHQLHQELEVSAAVRENHLNELQDRITGSLSSLTKIEQAEYKVRERDILSALDACEKWLASVPKEDKQSEQPEVKLDISSLSQAILQWGSFSKPEIKDLAPVLGVSYSNSTGIVTWHAAAEAVGYEVRWIGPFEEKNVNAVANQGHNQVHIESGTSWLLPNRCAFGIYRVQVRAQYEGGWSVFSEPLTFRVGLEWNPNKKHHSISVLQQGCTARLGFSPSGWDSALSLFPLRPASSGATAFDVRIDRHDGGQMFVGVCESLPGSSFVGKAPFVTGYSHGSLGDVYAIGERSSGLALYGQTDVIRVRVNFVEKTIMFFKNGREITQVRNVKVSQPLYACASMACVNDQVTFL